MTIKGYYFDGKSPLRRSVLLSREEKTLRLQGDGVDVCYPIDTVQVSAPLGNVRRSLRFADGALCELLDDSDLSRLMGAKDRPLHRFISHWERSIPLVLLALILTIATVIGFIRYGMPLITKRVVQTIPTASEKRLGTESLEMIDKYLMKPSKLPADKRRQVTDMFQRMKPDLPGARDYRLEFRSSKAIGANAFALPGGIIVVTDGMVELARTEGELAGVLAHEAGHQHARHALRHVLQSTGSGLLIAAITGDITSITTLSATLPTTLIDAGYSREFENEADDAAVAYCRRKGISPKVYAGMLARLQSDHDKKSGEKGTSKVWTPADLFASHPSTPERMQRVLGLAK